MELTLKPEIMKVSWAVSGLDQVFLGLCGSFIRPQGQVVRKPVNVNPGLKVNCSIIFSCLKMFSTSNVWCSLRLLQLKTEGQTI